MSARKKRNAQTQTEILGEYLDLSVWLGRFPSPGSSQGFESKKAFWMNRMRSSRRGNPHCKWYPELEEMAIERGFLDLFTLDLRLLWKRHFDLRGRVIVVPVKDIQCPNFPFNHVVVREEDGEPCFSIKVLKKADWRGDPGDQMIWMCTDGIDVSPFRSFQLFTAFDEFRSGEAHIPMIGKKFGRWTVLGFAERAGYNNEFIWFCLCECGSFRKIAGSRLRKGLSQSCGCLRADQFKDSEVEVEVEAEAVTL